VDRGDGVSSSKIRVLRFENESHAGYTPATFSTQALDFESTKTHAHYEPYSEGKTDIPE
jgi:hypothetical protein